MPKSFANVVHNSNAWNALIAYTGFKVIQEAERLMKEEKLVKPTPLVDFVMSLGICLFRVIGIRINRWGKFEVQCKEAIDILTLSKASPEEKEKLSWVPLSGYDEQVVQFLNSKMEVAPRTEQGEACVALAPNQEFLIKVNDVSKGKLYNGTYPLFASYQVYHIHYPKEKSSNEGESKDGGSGGATKKRKEAAAPASGAAKKARKGKKDSSASPPEEDGSSPVSEEGGSTMGGGSGVPMPGIPGGAILETEDDDDGLSFLP